MGVERIWSQPSMPMLRLPEQLPRPAIAIAAMVVLAGLDLAGAVLARRWAHGGSALWFAAGVACFGVLFWVYGSSLRYAELVPVTFGWIVGLQVGLMIIDRVRSVHALPAGHLLAATGIILLEGYLLLTAPAG